MLNPEALHGVDPKRARALLNNRAAGDLYAFLARTHSLVTPEASFIDADHLRVLAWHVQQAIEGKVRRLLIAVPPRHFKSHVASVAGPAWALGRNPGMRIICASYGTDLSKRFAEQTRQVVTSSLYREIFPKLELSSKTPALDLLKTRASGYRLATSAGGVLTGMGADLLVVDDPMKAVDAQSLTERENVHSWFKGSAMSRFDKPGEGVVIVVMQRLHQDDLIGRLLQEGGWTYLRLPAEADSRINLPCGEDTEFELLPGELLFPERFDHGALAQLRVDLGEAAYNAQILQAPAPAGGAMIKLKWMQRYTEPPAPHEVEMVLQVWDTALADSQSADYSVCSTWAVCGKKLLLLEVLRRQLPYHELEKLVLSQQARHKANLVLVEEAGTGILLQQNLARLQGLGWLKTIKPTGGKIERMAQQLPKLERGRVYLPLSAPWLEAFEHEVSEFPFGRFDDQVDSMAYALRLFDYGLAAPMLRSLSMYRDYAPGRPTL